MTIKKQFVLLSSLIITIPLLSILFIITHRYLTSSQRLIMSGSENIEKSYKKTYSKQEWADIKNEFKNLPPDVEALVLKKNSENETYLIVLSTISDYQSGTTIDVEDFWSEIQNSSPRFFYQFSKINDDENTLYATRIPKKKQQQDKTPKPNIVYPLLYFLFGFVAVILVILILISRGIFKSISLIEKSTQEIADGNLNAKININGKKFKSNEITSIADSLEKMRISLLEAQNRKTKLIMGISHDLRTPVAVIKGYTEGLRDGIITDPEEVKTSLNLIETKSSQLEGMIDSLISYTKMNTSEIHDSLTPENITKLIKDFATECKNTIGVFERELITDIQLPQNIFIPLNAQLVHRAFENIFSNALRYTEKNDTISILASLGTTEDHKKAIIFKIQDTGIGISEEDRTHIFDLFYRASLSRHEEGMGIGLSVVQNIIDIHGWDIKVESEKGKGSCFIITIPY